jgi:Domain of unknown function (DUF4261)
MSLSIAMVALGKGAKLSGNAIQRDLQETWPSLPSIGPLEKKDMTLSFDVGDDWVALGLMPAPIPWSDLEGPCETSWIWPSAADDLKQHTGHVIVTVSSEDEPIERAKLLTQVCASILATTEQSIGVYWGDATLVIRKDIFRDFAVEILPDGLPIYAWIDFRVRRNEDDLSSGFTTGLKALGHMELETENASDKPGDLRERLVAIASYLLENGPVIKDGNTVGEDANERITVRYAKSAFGHKDKVMRLDYSSVGRTSKRNR